MTIIRPIKQPLIILLTFGLLATSVLNGCRSTEPTQSSNSVLHGQRMIKVSFRGQHGSFRLRINQQPVEKFRNTDFTNVMIRLQLEYGDIVFWDDQRDKSGKELSQPDGIARWWFKYLEGAQASFYAIGLDSASDFFETPIYHWKAPADKPRPLQNATFLVDGIPLGQGSAGFQMMMASMERQKSGPVYIVAPRIKNEGQASPWIADDQLFAWADEAGVRLEFEKIFYGRYAGSFDFARFGDE